MSEIVKTEYQQSNLKFIDEVNLLMQGTLDLHVHAGPSLIPRRLDPVEAAKQAAEAGLKAILVKDHHWPLVREVYFIKKYVFQNGIDVDILSGVALNRSIGGINPHAVEAALDFGARMVWLPTISSRNHIEYHKKKLGISFPSTEKHLLEEKPIYLLDNKGNLPDELNVIMEQVRDADAVLSMGHVSVPEIFAVLDRARDMGLRRLVVNHPTFIIQATDNDIMEFVEKGAFIEFSACMTDRRSKFYFIPAIELKRLLLVGGLDSVFIGSDLGQHDTPPPVEGLMVVADALLAEGMKMGELRHIFQDNPQKIVY
ncbi:MAG: DUF6282 family protein [Thermodesulfobacteriota bacterium]|jgi:hypothetical protein